MASWIKEVAVGGCEFSTEGISDIGVHKCHPKFSQIAILYPIFCIFVQKFWDKKNFRQAKICQAYRVCKNMTKFVLSKLRQISKKNLVIFSIQIGKTIKICEVHSVFTSPNLCQRTTVVKRRCSKLLHYTVNIMSIRLFIFSLSIRQKAPRDLIILWY